MTLAAFTKEDEELTLDEMRSRFQNLWVAFIVTRRDKNGQPTAGKVVAEDADRYRLRNAIYNYTDICIFFAGENPYPLLL